MISTIVFDLFGTLTGAETQRARHVALLADVLEVPVEELASELRTSYDERARGVFGDVRQQLIILSQRLGGVREPDVIDLAVEVRMEGQRAVLEPRVGTIETLRSIRDLGIPVGVLSDCTAEIPRLWAGTEYAPFVAKAVFSCEMGVRKPDPRMYQAVLSALGKEPSESLYVGDGGSSELSGALAMGMRPVWLRIEEERHARYDQEIDWGGECIADLAEVIGLLS